MQNRLARPPLSLVVLLKLHPISDAIKCLKASVAVNVDTLVAAVSAIAIPQPTIVKNALAQGTVPPILCWSN